MAFNPGFCAAHPLGHGLSPALAERADTTTNVEFTSGSSAKRLSGKIKGDQRARYILPGKAGHKLSVEITASNSRTLFEGKLPKTGEYLITVYLGRGPPVKVRFPRRSADTAGTGSF